MSSLGTISELNSAIEAGQTSSGAVVASAVARLNDPCGEGARAFVRANRNAEREGQAFDVLRQGGALTSPLAGLPISIKDNIDARGSNTTVGTKILASRPAAAQDSAVVKRLRGAGAVIMGHTNMSEFAFSGVGTNPHHGTPLNPFDRELKRIPGGSSSGAAISVADGMAVAAVGTDTGGSIRIPAALCGLTGFKPTQARISRVGVFPLSTVLDCVGVIAQNVDDCRILDQVLSGDAGISQTPSTSSIRLCILSGPMMDGCDHIVQSSLERALKRIRDAGISVSNVKTDVFKIIDDMSARGTYAAAEAWEALGHLLETDGGRIDDKIVDRISKGRTISASDMIRNDRDRVRIMRTIDDALDSFDCVVSPTVPVVAPQISEIEQAQEFHRINLLLLRNPSLANLADLPSISLSCNAPGAAPVGIMLTGRRNGDGKLLAVAEVVEKILRASWDWVVR